VANAVLGFRIPRLADGLKDGEITFGSVITFEQLFDIEFFKVVWTQQSSIRKLWLLLIASVRLDSGKRPWMLSLSTIRMFNWKAERLSWTPVRASLFGS
jgi:hypothetical protein